MEKKAASVVCCMALPKQNNMFCFNVLEDLISYKAFSAVLNDLPLRTPAAVS